MLLSQGSEAIVMGFSKAFAFRETFKTADGDGLYFIIIIIKLVRRIIQNEC